ncbi:MAG: creatininase family protein [Anaerolineae bacterium]|nr:creatininase family protein [Anaerolineae bacterium]
MNFAQMNWMQVAAYLEHDDRILLAVGTTEQHGYLSLETDNLIPAALVKLAEERSGVLSAPILPLGVSPYFLQYPGSISLRVETFVAMIEDVVRSLYGHGFRRFVIVNGHGGNNCVKPKLIELSNQLPGMSARWYAWWQSARVAQWSAAHDLLQEHANWMENFPFTRVAPVPAGVKPPVINHDLDSAAVVRASIGDGSFGGHYQVSDAWMEELLQLCADELVEILAEPAPSL